ncbi:MAG: uroporphyrinogen-III synthase [Actinobacteria bacterium]|nr:MAG: uroporphyrinogen-III synthase [Actinomycetota bacterium]
MTIPASDGGIGGLTVMAFESRRASELESLIRRHGGAPLVVPSMREVPLQDDAALDLLRELEAGGIEMVIVLTGVGLRTLAERCPPERLAASLARTTLVARGPKPIAELRKLGLTPQVSVPEPNTWREILSTIDAQAPVGGLRVAVLEYGVTNEELIAELESRGAGVLRVALYRWALPEDQRPLRQAVSRLATTGVDFVLFTSRRQVDHVIMTAGELGLADALVDRARLMIVASIGPVCSEALRRHGLPVDLEPEHPKMGHLVVAVARRGPDLLSAKRAAHERERDGGSGEA